MLTAGALTLLTITSLGATSSNSSTNESDGLSDLVDDITRALTNARLKDAGEISIREDLSDDIAVGVEGSRIKLSSATAFTLTVADGDPAMNKLGFKAEHVAEADGAVYALTTTKNIPRYRDRRYQIYRDGGGR